MLLTIVNTINGYLWSMALIAMCLGIAVYYSVVMRFPQIRYIKTMVSSVKGGDSEQGITPFQAFAMALGGRIGIGTIAGVATGIHFGGPGAVFWMWIYAILGSATAFGEAVLAQIWKEDIKGEYRGGPAYYLRKTPIPALGSIFMVFAIFGFAFTGPTIQAFNIADSMYNAWGINQWVSGFAQAAVFGIVVIGGMRRIGRFAEYVVPFMAAIYMLVTVIILIININAVPGMFMLIIKSAFNLEATYGAIIGSAIAWGIRRSVYSSEAGMGSGAHAAASSEVAHPVQQGMAQAFSVYMTLIVCTCTALMIMVTGTYNVVDGQGAYLYQGLPNIEEGIGYTQAAIDTLSPGTTLGSQFIALAILFFAFTTLLSFGFYAEVNIANYLKGSKHLKKVIVIIVCIQMFAIVLGSVRSSTLAWGIADIGVALSVWVNLFGMLFLGGVCAKCMKDYDNQIARDITKPIFNPEQAGIQGAELWNGISEKYYKKADQSSEG